MCFLVTRGTPQSHSQQACLLACAVRGALDRPVHGPQARVGQAVELGAPRLIRLAHVDLGHGVAPLLQGTARQLGSGNDVWFVQHCKHHGRIQQAS